MTAPRAEPNAAVVTDGPDVPIECDALPFSSISSKC